MCGLVFEGQENKANSHTRPKRDLGNFLTFMYLLLLLLLLLQLF